MGVPVQPAVVDELRAQHTHVGARPALDELDGHRLTARLARRRVNGALPLTRGSPARNTGMLTRDYKPAAKP